MNYFEFHLGDYAEATAHLSFVEDAAYLKLLRKVYATEKPLPADKKACQRLVGARTKDERDAVDSVLDEFFTLSDDGWRNARADRDIATFKAGEPEREAKRANEEARLKRHRDERSKLFQAIAAAGHSAPWNIGMNELRDIAKRCVPPLPATAPATPATATQYPVPNTQTPIPITQGKEKRAASRPPDVRDAVWADWVAHRKAKRAPVSDTAIEGARAEASKLGWTLERFLAEWVTRGSQGLKAEWITPAAAKPTAMTTAERNASAARLLGFDTPETTQ